MISLRMLSFSQSLNNIREQHEACVMPSCVEIETFAEHACERCTYIRMMSTCELTHDHHIMHRGLRNHRSRHGLLFSRGYLHAYSSRFPPEEQTNINAMISWMFRESGVFGYSEEYGNFLNGSSGINCVLELGVASGYAIY